MPLSIRLLVGFTLLGVGHLAMPGAALGEPDASAVWMGEPAAEPAVAAPVDELGPTSVEPPPAADTDTVSAPDVDLWAESFYPTTSTASVAAPEPARPPIPRGLALASAPPTTAKKDSTYQIQQNDHVQRFIEQFQTGYRRAVVERWLTRSGRYLPMILEIFRQRGLPEELVFTAMIESGFDPVAVSRVGAKGLWQFMAPTARQYGLRVDRWLDERLDPEKSTVAAARYFKDLYTIFGSWELVQAAYNAGEMKVLRAIQGTGTRDFWSLTRSRLLRDETKNFVPAIHAVTIIGQGPEQYGFEVKPDEPLSYEQITVPKATSLKHVASLSGIPLEELVRLNSELRLKQTPPDSPYRLKVPLGTAAGLQAGLDREVEARKAAALTHAPEHAKRKAQVRGGSAASAGVHVVQARETIGGIAKRYGVSVEQLTRWNDLEEGRRIVPGERLRVSALAARHQESEQGGFR